MYTIEIIKHKIKSEHWGAFKVKKGFNVIHPEIDKDDISGYIIQRVEKQCKARVLYRDWETDRKSTRLNSSH